MSEFLTILVGQCGNQIGSVLLPEILREYGIKTQESTPNKNEKSRIQEKISSFFNVEKPRTFTKLSDLVRAKVKARFLCVDMEENVVARNKHGKYRDLYENMCFITNNPGSGNNFAEGYYSHGPKYHDEILNGIQYHMDKSDCIHGFLLVFSMGGGTGSGLGSFILRLLQENFPKIDRFVVCVYPTGTEDVITCPYNMSFASMELLNNASCVFPVENRAVFDIVKKHSKHNEKHMNRDVSMFASFNDVNSVIVDMMLHVTSGARFAGEFNLDMNDLCTNMVPFPKLNFLSTGLSPFSFTTDKLDLGEKQPKSQIFLNACSRNNQLVKIDPLGTGQVSLGFTLLGRGSYVISELRTQLDRLLSARLKYADWSRKSSRLALCHVAPIGRDCAMLATFNCSAMADLFRGLRQHYVKLYTRKAHVHHYTNIEGFDIENFGECLTGLDDILDVYQNIGTSLT